MMQGAPDGRRVRFAAALAALTGTLLLVPTAALRADMGSVEHIRGIYMQRAIEIATVGARTVRLTPMTRFRRCSRFRGVAQDFNDHLVDVIGRHVEGIGFVAGFVNAIEGCSTADVDVNRPNEHGANESGMGMGH